MKMKAKYWGNFEIFFLILVSTFFSLSSFSATNILGTTPGFVFSTSTQTLFVTELDSKKIHFELLPSSSQMPGEKNHQSNNEGSRWIHVVKQTPKFSKMVSPKFVEKIESENRGRASNRIQRVNNGLLRSDSGLEIRAWEGDAEEICLSVQRRNVSESKNLISKSCFNFSKWKTKKSPKQKGRDGQAEKEGGEGEIEIATDYSLGNKKEIEISWVSQDTVNIYGLGEQFVEPGQVEGDWLGLKRTPGNVHGNSMEPFAGGMVANAQFPIFYAMDNESAQYGVFFDHTYAMNFDFTARESWSFDTFGEGLRWILIPADSLLEIRKNYLEIVGPPPVPPKQAFGLWVSEFGYNSWQELDEKHATLEENKFPLDGFVLDLQWFGGVRGKSDNSPMGSLTWDLEKFPEPANRIKDLDKRYGIKVIPIEESYISRGLDEHKFLDENDFLVKNKNGESSYITYNPWWGKGGMIDWSNPRASQFWHLWKRKPLLEAGVFGHWTDLGEPEMYNDDSRYFGNKDQFDVHNLFNLYWHQGILDGYRRDGLKQRPFLLTRSGTSGIQRMGAAMWSGDIGTNFESLASHYNVQSQMSFSGVDYFGSDIGGFYRDAFKGTHEELDELYTQWFAFSALFDLPVRPHTLNICNCHDTPPDRIGDLKSNLENIRFRYQLAPYLYSLAYKAHLDAEPLFPQASFYFESDLELRKLASHKMIGRDLLVRSVSEKGARETKVYLPKGDWFDFWSRRWVRSAGQWFENVPIYYDGVYRLPVFVRDGAMIPMLNVDEQTMTVMGKRRDSSRASYSLHIFSRKAFAKNRSSEQEIRSTIFDDNGWSIDYLDGEFSRTKISMSSRSEQLKVDLSYGGSRRFKDVYFYVDGLSAKLNKFSFESGWRPAQPRVSLGRVHLELSGEPKRNSQTGTAQLRIRHKKLD